ncbi:MAG TPA: hypothetical protein PKE29_05075 [Phycisphaerales bacterium]|nr:hypothetical protein [Phycisphaerales bacterium]
MKTLIGLPCAVVALAAGLAQAQTLVQSDWEAPLWSVGAVSGQNGWTNFNSTLGHQVVTASSASILARSGVNVERSLTSATSGLERDAYLDITAGWATRTDGSTLAVELWVYLPATSTSGGLHGVDVFSSMGVPGAFFVSSFDGKVVATDAQLNLLDTGVTVSRDTWTRFNYYLNFTDGSAALYVDGAYVYGSAFDNTTHINLTDVDIANISQGTGGSTAYTDDFSVRVIPGPGALTLAGLGGLVLARRRR